MDNSYDFAIIGGGIVGLATARALGERAPRARLVILEKEAKLATHQTGNNSGVIHSGIYYKPGSYKAKLCGEGKGLMLDFCAKHGIRVDHVGKVIVATSQAELPRLQTLYDRGVANGVPVAMLEPAQLREIEPHAIALRGEYYMIRPARQDIVRGLIYPVPDPEFPFLGVHLTRTVHGEVEAGPNAVLAFAREGYRFGRVSPSELAGTLAYRGFWQMARRYWRMGSYEMYRSLSKDAFVRALQRLVSILRSEDVTRGGAGVRAQAGSPHRSLGDDFPIVAEADAIHVLNAPSPGATASLAIGRHIAGLAVDTFGLT